MFEVEVERGASGACVVVGSSPSSFARARGRGKKLQFFLRASKRDRWPPRPRSLARRRAERQADIPSRVKSREEQQRPLARGEFGGLERGRSKKQAEQAEAEQIFSAVSPLSFSLKTVDRKTPSFARHFEHHPPLSRAQSHAAAYSTTQRTRPQRRGTEKNGALRVMRAGRSSKKEASFFCFLFFFFNCGVVDLSLSLALLLAVLLPRPHSPPLSPLLLRMIRYSPAHSMTWSPEGVLRVTL